MQSASVHYASKAITFSWRLCPLAAGMTMAYMQHWRNLDCSTCDLELCPPSLLHTYSIHYYTLQGVPCLHDKRAPSGDLCPSDFGPCASCFARLCENPVEYYSSLPLHIAHSLVFGSLLLPHRVTLNPCFACSSVSASQVKKGTSHQRQ